jgi:hypothetical protein
MQPLSMGKKVLDDLYNKKSLDSTNLNLEVKIDKISEREKFIAAKQILFGLAVLYVMTIIAFMINPKEGNKLLDITTVTFPPLATLILASYFREKIH